MQNDSHSVLLELYREMGEGKTTFLELSAPLQQAIDSDTTMRIVTERDGLFGLRNYLQGLSYCGF